MLYRPKLNNGKNVPLSWPIAMYRFFHIVCWPLSEDATRLEKAFDRFCYIFTFVLFVQLHDAEFRFIRLHSHDMDLMLAGVADYLVLIEVTLRAFQLGLQKDKFRQFLQKYYTKIYIEE